MKSQYIWMDGKLVPYEQANIHILSSSLHYGTAAFEGIRCYEGKGGSAVFRLREHMQRFVDTCKIIGVQDYPYSIEALEQAVFETIRANGFKSCYIRPIMYLADGPLGLNMDKSKPKTAVAVWEWGPYLGASALEKGIRATVSSWQRNYHNAAMTKAKVAGNYVNSMMAKTFALRSGFDEAILLDTNGFLSECSGENIFLVRGGAIYTPERATILEGVTRDAMITLARDLDIRVVEETISRDQLYIADEIFLCGTAAECVGVREIDTRVIGSGSVGPITKRIQKAFFDTVQGDGKRSSEWLAPVPPAR